MNMQIEITELTHHEERGCSYRHFVYCIPFQGYPCVTFFGVMDSYHVAYALVVG